MEKIQLSEVRKKAKILNLKIQVTGSSFGKFGTVQDLKSIYKTSGNIYPKNDPECINFLNRLKDLRSFIGDREICHQGLKIIGIN